MKMLKRMMKVGGFSFVIGFLLILIVSFVPAEATDYDWVKVNTSHSPTQTDPAWKRPLAFDAARAETVLLVEGSPSETWVYDGMDWMKRNPAHSPTATNGGEPGFCYDSRRERVVLFGGNGGSSNLNDTWEWNGLDWIKRDIVHKPSVRRDFEMAYDSNRGVVVEFSGAFVGADTWEYDGTDWTQTSPVHHPDDRWGHSMAFDTFRNVIVLNAGCYSRHDTWEYNGNDWTCTVAEGRGSEDRPMIYHPELKACLKLDTNETLIYKGTNWEVLETDHYLSLPRDAGMAYDSQRGVVVVVTTNSETYELVPANPPPVLDFEEFSDLPVNANLALIEPNLGGLDWTTPNTEPHWRIKSSGLPFEGSGNIPPDGHNVWFLGTAGDLGAPPKARAKIIWLDNTFDFVSMDLRGRSAKSAWLTEVRIRFRDPECTQSPCAPEDEVIKIVTLTDEWVTLTAEDVEGLENLDSLKAIIFEAPGGVNRSGDTARFGLDNFTYIPSE